MRRPKLKSSLNNDKLNPPDAQREMSPWNENQSMYVGEEADKIPTYRRQIMQRFLGNLQLRNKRSQKYLVKGSSIDKKQSFKNEITCHTLNESSRKSKTQQSVKNNCPQINNTIKILRQQYEKKKKPVKAKVINFDANFISTEKQKQQFRNRSLEQISKSFTRKMRLKESISNKKNIEQVRKKIQTKTTTNVFKNNTFFLCQFEKIQSTKNSVRNNMYKRASSLRKRPNSEQYFRSNQSNC